MKRLMNKHKINSAELNIKGTPLRFFEMMELKISLCKISDHSHTSFSQKNYSNCKNMTKNEKRLNAFHSNRAKK
jgi:hypothetical protein